MDYGKKEFSVTKFGGIRNVQVNLYFVICLSFPSETKNHALSDRPQYLAYYDWCLARVLHFVD